MRYDAVMFDVDGTLIDSAPGIFRTFAYTFKTMGVNPDTIDLKRYLGPPLRWSFGQHFSEPAMVEKAVATYRKHYDEQADHGCKLFPGVEAMLKALYDRGIFLATATSKEQGVAKNVLEEVGILKYFALVGGSSMDASVDTKTAVIRQNLQDKRLAAKRTLMVGDRKDDMQGAVDCKLTAAAVLYGYGSREELEAWHPAILANTCNELTKYILENEFSGS